MQRDPNFIVLLLKECEGRDDSSILCPATLGMSDEKLKRRHHLHIMQDARLVADRTGNDTVFEITNAGHDFLAAHRNPKIWEQLLAKLNEGMPLISALNFVRELF